MELDKAVGGTMRGQQPKRLEVSNDTQGESSGAQQGESASVQMAMVELHQQVETIDIRTIEDESVENLAKTWVPKVAQLVDEGLAALSHLRLSSEAHPSEDRETGSFDTRVDALMNPDRRALDDLVVLSQFELRHKAQELEALSSSLDRDQILPALSSALRRLGKITTAIENAAAGLAGAKPILSFVTGLASALRARRAFGKFRRDLGRAGESDLGADIDAAEVANRLRSTATAIACLVGRDEYADLRYEDRVELRALQRRIMDWMSGKPLETRKGVHILQDLAGFVGLLARISSRSELLGHDRYLVLEAETAIFGQASQPGDHDSFPEEWFERLQELYGLDPRMDELLAADRVTTCGEWRPILEGFATCFLEAMQARATKEWVAGESAEFAPTQVVPPVSTDVSLPS